ncbi:MAG: hypothetical protein ACSHWQ_07490 [Spongiibacteraceae bacterium]
MKAIVLAAALMTAAASSHAQVDALGTVLNPLTNALGPLLEQGAMAGHDNLLQPVIGLVSSGITQGVGPGAPLSPLIDLLQGPVADGYAASLAPVVTELVSQLSGPLTGL